MGIVNKRNAVLGWTVWNIGKRMARKKARSVVPGDGGDKKGAVAGIVSGLAAVGGALWFLRRRKPDEQPE